MGLNAPVGVSDDNLETFQDHTATFKHEKSEKLNFFGIN